jgi:hypothetical protein
MRLTAYALTAWARPKTDGRKATTCCSLATSESTRSPPPQSAASPLASNDTRRAVALHTTRDSKCGCPAGGASPASPTGTNAWQGPAALRGACGVSGAGSAKARLRPGPARPPSTAPTRSSTVFPMLRTGLTPCRTRACTPESGQQQRRPAGAQPCHQHTGLPVPVPRPNVATPGGAAASRTRHGPQTSRAPATVGTPAAPLLE